MNKSDSAVATFSKGLNCAQAVLSAFNKELGLDDQVSARIASGFGGGIAHMA